MIARVAAVFLFLLLLVPFLSRAEFDAAAYRPATQEQLVREAEANAGKKFQVTDTFQYCGSDFCVQVLKTKFDTRQYYCFAIGPVCIVRMYLKKDHPDVPQLLKMKKGERLTVFGTYNLVGKDFHYLVADRVIPEKPR